MHACMHADTQHCNVTEITVGNG